MLIVSNRKKTELILVILGFVIITLIIDFFLPRIRTEGVWEWALLSVAFFLLTPLFIAKMVWKKPLKEYFLSFELSKKKILLTTIATLIYVAVMWLFVVQLNWKGNLSVSRWVLGSTGLLVFIDLVVLPFVVFAKEFFFRGFVLGTASSAIGVLGAILLQAFLQVVYELYISGFAEWGASWPQPVLMMLMFIFLGTVAWLNKSIVFSAFLYWIHIIVVDLYFAYQLAQPG